MAVQAKTIHGFRCAEGKKVHLFPDCSALTFAKRAQLVEGQYEVADDKAVCYDCRKRKFYKEKRNRQ